MRRHSSHQINRDFIKWLLERYGLVVNNEYLERYLSLIFSNIKTKSETFYTQEHHIIPTCFYKRLFSLPSNIDSTKFDKNNFKINLDFCNHVLAHCYLAKCSTDDWFKEANLIAIRTSVDKEFSGLTDLDIDNLIIRLESDEDYRNSLLISYQESLLNRLKHRTDSTKLEAVRAAHKKKTN